MCPYWVSNLGPLAYKSDALPTALHGPAVCLLMHVHCDEYSMVLIPFIFSN